jgi:hypothetical protein
MKLWQLTALLLALIGAVPIAFSALGTFAKPAERHECAAPQDQLARSMCREMGKLP